MRDRSRRSDWARQVERLSQPLPKHVDQWTPSKLRAIIRCRTRRAWWVYLIWLPIYWITATVLGDSLGLTQWWLVPFTSPIAIVVLQWIYPTILGWVVIFVITIADVGIWAYAAINDIVQPNATKYDQEETVLFFVLFGISFGVCIALLIARPKLNEKPKSAPGICEVCGYDLRATPDRCPECGTVPPR